MEDVNALSPQGPAEHSEPSLSDSLEQPSDRRGDAQAAPIRMSEPGRRSSETDEGLLEKIAQHRSKEAFSEFYDRFSGKVYSLLMHMLRSEQDAQDLLQEVFVLIWQKAPLYLEQRGNATGWVVSLARNRAVDELRSKRHKEKSQETELLLDDDRPSLERLLRDDRTPDSGLHFTDAQREISRALSVLTPEQRKVIDLSYFAGLTHQEISEQLQIPLGTVKTRLRQAVLKLGELLKPLF